MVDKNDWRLTSQEKYLMGKTLYWLKYKPNTDKWEHEHCEFCWNKFMDDDYPDVLREGYTTEDSRHWICEQCFEDFKDMFQWKLGKPHYD